MSHRSRVFGIYRTPEEAESAVDQLFRSGLTGGISRCFTRRMRTQENSQEGRALDCRLALGPCVQ
jgi:hypothetical protein